MPQGGLSGNGPRVIANLVPLSVETHIQGGPTDERRAGWAAVVGALRKLISEERRR